MLKVLFNSHQRRFVQLLVLLFLLAGLGTSVYLNQQKTNLFSRAVSAPTPIGCSSTNPNCPAGYKCQLQACTLRYCPENDPNCNTCTGKCVPIPTSKLNPRFEVGLEAGEQHDTSRVSLVAESGAKWVRLNFVGTDWSVVSSDVNTYNSIVNEYQGQGIKIIGLIGAQSVAGGYDRGNPEGFTQRYTDTTEAIIDRFGDRVKVYELFNEPNDWAGSNSAQLSPGYFAQYLSRIYRQIKITRGKTDILLNSGPLLSHDSDTGAEYLQSTYEAGKSSTGSANWETIKSQTGSYPLDGVGYHIYVAQGMADVGLVESRIRYNLSAIEAVINSSDPGKKLWITEFGWGTGTGRVTETVQSDNLKKAYAIFKNDSSIRMAMWFTLKDFDANQWGLIKSDETKKIAWSSFQEINGIVVPTPTATPTPTPTPSGPTCNINAVVLNVSPNQANPGQQINFTINGDASTFLHDDFGGGATNCSGEWNNKTCTTATQSGTYIWVHAWKHCEGSFDNCSNQCSKAINFAILSPTPTPASVACTACRANITQGGRVSINDMMIAARCMGKRLTDSVGRYSCRLADVDGNGQINLSDLNCVSRQFNQQCLPPRR